jgi:hypothetical protein
LTNKVLNITKEKSNEAIQKYKQKRYKQLQAKNLTAEKYNILAKRIEEEAAKREQPKSLNYILPPLGAILGTGLGYLGYRKALERRSTTNLLDTVQNMNTQNVIKEAMAYAKKDAAKTAEIKVEKGNVLTRATGHLTGGLTNALMLSPFLTGDMSSFREGDIEKMRALAEAMEGEFPKELDNVKVIQGGGTRYLDTLKRHFTNKRTGLVGKALGLP